MLKVVVSFSNRVRSLFNILASGPRLLVIALRLMMSCLLRVRVNVSVPMKAVKKIAMPIISCMMLGRGNLTTK